MNNLPIPQLGQVGVEVVGAPADMVRFISGLRHAWPKVTTDGPYVRPDDRVAYYAVVQVGGIDE